MLNSSRYSGLVLLALLLACLMLSAGCSRGEQGADTEKELLNNLISGYFSSWSKPDMEAYKGCFHPEASIYFIDGSGNPHYSGLEEFIAGQQKVHQAARERLSERPMQTSLTVHGRLAGGQKNQLPGSLPHPGGGRAVYLCDPPVLPSFGDATGPI